MAKKNKIKPVTIGSEWTDIINHKSSITMESNDKFIVKTINLEIPESYFDSLINSERLAFIKSNPKDKIKLSKKQIDIIKKYLKKDYDFSLDVNDLLLTKFKLISGKKKQFLVYDNYNNYLMELKEIIEKENKVVFVPSKIKIVLDSLKKIGEVNKIINLNDV